LKEEPEFSFGDHVKPFHPNDSEGNAGSIFERPVVWYGMRYSMFGKQLLRQLSTRRLVHN